MGSEKPRKAMIHIGMGKTGSSAIQEFFTKLNNEKVLYPVISETGHQNIEVLFREYESVGRGIKSNVSEGLYSKFKSDFKEKLESELKTGTDVLISAEYLFNFTVKEVASLRSYLELHNINEFKVIAYVRAPEKFYLSALQQRLKASYKVESPSSFKVGFKRRLSAWMEVFGKENVLVREYSRETLIQRDVIHDFVSQYNNFFETNVEARPISANKSMSAIGMYLMQSYRKAVYNDEDNRFKPDSSRLLSLILRDSVYHEPPKLKLTAKAAIIKNHLNEYKFLNENFDIFADVMKEIGAFEAQNSVSDFPENVLLSDVLENEVDDMLVQSYTLEILSKLLKKEGLN
tara:strand:+ start:308 stop:1345 length:1038 start_codon:yes stop_codon:yes gene_type:complete